jgi:hypothetical protein
LWLLYKVEFLPTPGKNLTEHFVSESITIMLCLWFSFCKILSWLILIAVSCEEWKPGS